MKTLHLVIIIVITGVLFMIVMMSGETCIVVVKGSPNNWLGSTDGCGPTLTYEIHRYFGIFWK